MVKIGLSTRGRPQISDLRPLVLEQDECQVPADVKEIDLTPRAEIHYKSESGARSIGYSVRGTLEQKKFKMSRDIIWMNADSELETLRQSDGRSG